MAAALLIALLAGIPAQAADDPPEWRQVDATTGLIADLPGLEQLARDFPDSTSVRLRLLNAYLEADMNAAGLRLAIELIKQGHVFSEGARELLLSLDPTENQKLLLATQDPSFVPVEASVPLAELPVEAQLVESVWEDGKTGDLFVTTVVSRSLFVRRTDGAWTKLPIDGAGSLSGIAHDPRSGILWISSGVFEQTPDPQTAFRGLIGIDPMNGSIVRRVAAPAGATPGDLALADDGTVYVSDPLAGAIYLGAPANAQLDMIVAPGTFRSPQGLAELPGREALIVSDYRYGLARVDLRTGRVARIANASWAALDGIDGLWLRGNRLVAIQNGSSPARITELELSTDGSSIVDAWTREAANPAWTEPVGGSLSNGRLVYVATGQWDRFGPGGSTVADRPPQPTQIRALPVGAKSPPVP